MPRSASAVDERRCIGGYLATWHTRAPQLDRHHKPYWHVVDRGAFDVFLSTQPERRLVMDVDHREEVGYFIQFTQDSRGLLALAVVDDGYRGDQVLTAVDEGVFRGFSVRGLSRRIESAGVWQGLPVYRSLELQLISAGVVHEPADPYATIETVSGRRPYFRTVTGILSQTLGTCS